MSIERVSLLRVLCAAVGLVTAVGAVMVAAPALGLLALPFVVAAVGMRTGRPLPLGLLTVWSLLHVALSVQFALANGIDAAWSDLLSVYVGGPLAGMVALVGFNLLLSRRPAES